MLELYVDVSLEKLRFGEAIGEVLQLVRRHGLLLPGTLVDFFKALAMCEGVVQNINPDSSFADYLQPLVRKLIYQAFAGPDLLGRLRDSAADAAELSIALPRRCYETLRADANEKPIGSAPQETVAISRTRRVACDQNTFDIFRFTGGLP